MTSRSLRIAVTALSVAALAAGPAASASRQPTSVESRDIRVAVQAFFGQWYYGDTSKLVHVGGIRIASADANWASASVSGPTASGRFELSGPYRTVLLWHATGTSRSSGDGPGGRRWIVVEAGVGMGEYFGCGIAPDKVNTDLFRSINGGC